MTDATKALDDVRRAVDVLAEAMRPPAAPRPEPKFKVGDAFVDPNAPKRTFVITAPPKWDDSGLGWRYPGLDCGCVGNWGEKCLSTPSRWLPIPPRRQVSTTSEPWSLEELQTYRKALPEMLRECQQRASTIPSVLACAERFIISLIDEIDGLRTRTAGLEAAIEAMHDGTIREAEKAKGDPK